MIKNINIFILLIIIAQLTMLSSCGRQEGLTNTEVRHDPAPTAPPTAVPTPCKNADFQITISLTPTEKTGNFISNEVLNFKAQSILNPDLNTKIQWKFIDQNFKNDSNTAEPYGFIGENYAFIMRPRPLTINTPYSGIGRGYLLKYQIWAIMQKEDKLDFANYEITQNNLAELRQEYIDFYVGVPEENQFDIERPGDIVKCCVLKKHSIPRC